LGKQNINDIVGHEVHSTFASVLNDYGLIGFILLASAVVKWARALWRRFGLTGLFCLTAPSLLYGITHNGTRFTIFWLLFASSMAMAGTQRVLEKRPAVIAEPSNHRFRRGRFA